MERACSTCHRRLEGWEIHAACVCCRGLFQAETGGFCKGSAEDCKECEAAPLSALATYTKEVARFNLAGGNTVSTSGKREESSYSETATQEGPVSAAIDIPLPSSNATTGSLSLDAPKAYDPRFPTSGDPPAHTSPPTSTVYTEPIVTTAPMLRVESRPYLYRYSDHEQFQNHYVFYDHLQASDPMPNTVDSSWSQDTDWKSASLQYQRQPPPPPGFTPVVGQPRGPAPTSGAKLVASEPNWTSQAPLTTATSQGLAPTDVRAPSARAAGDPEPLISIPPVACTNPSSPPGTVGPSHSDSAAGGRPRQPRTPWTEIQQEENRAPSTVSRAPPPQEPRSSYLHGREQRDVPPSPTWDRDPYLGSRYRYAQVGTSAYDRPTARPYTEYYGRDTYTYGRETYEDAYGERDYWDHRDPYYPYYADYEDRWYAPPPRLPSYMPARGYRGYDEEDDMWPQRASRPRYRTALTDRFAHRRATSVPERSTREDPSDRAPRSPPRNPRVQWADSEDFVYHSPESHSEGPHAEDVSPAGEQERGGRSLPQTR